MKKKKDEKSGFNPSAYVTEYKKNNYKRHEVLLRQEDDDKLKAILNDKKMTFTDYTKENIKRDIKAIKKAN